MKLTEAETFISTLVKISDKHDVALTGKQIMNAINAWRGGVRHEHKLKEGEYEKRMEAYKTTSNDTEAGKLVGLGTSGFNFWRSNTGLPPKG